MNRLATILIAGCICTIVACVQTQSPPPSEPGPPARKKWSCPIEVRADHGMSAQSDIRFRLRTPVTDDPLPTAQVFDFDNLEITDESGRRLALHSIDMGLHKDGFSISGNVRTQAPHPTRVHFRLDVRIVFARENYESVNIRDHVAFTYVWDGPESTWQLDEKTPPIVRKIQS